MVMRGGLGNQLFQYAFMRELADRLGEDLELDTRFYPSMAANSSLGLWIDKLPIRAAIKRYSDSGPFAAHGVLLRLQRKLIERRLRPVFKETDAGFNEQALHIQPNSIVYGYFQSADYFEPFCTRLRGELNCMHLLSSSDRLLAEDIRENGRTSVHVRRGDYLTEKGFTIAGYDTYLRNAMDHMRSLREGVKFFVFSDDVAWCRNSDLFADSCEIYSGGTSNPMIDLHLMSMCSEHIISNSSFSWWAAWLGDHPDKTVIAPATWFGGIDTRTARIIPDHWVVKGASRSSEVSQQA